jgi:hypothetical protein
MDSLSCPGIPSIGSRPSNPSFTNIGMMRDEGVTFASAVKSLITLLFLSLLNLIIGK